MRIAKTIIVNEAAKINALNLAIGAKAKDIFALQDEVAAVTGPFVRFRDKLAADMGVKGSDHERWGEFVEGLNRFLDGDVEIEHVHFLTEDELWKALEPLLAGGTLQRVDIELIRGLLIEETEL